MYQGMYYEQCNTMARLGLIAAIIWILVRHITIFFNEMALSLSTSSFILSIMCRFFPGLLFNTLLIRSTYGSINIPLEQVISGQRSNTPCFVLMTEDNKTIPGIS